MRRARCGNCYCWIGKDAYWHLDYGTFWNGENTAWCAICGWSVNNPLWKPIVFLREIWGWVICFPDLENW